MELTTLTRTDVCKIFSVTPRTIIRWERAGILKPSFYIARRPRYSLEAINAAIEDKQTRPKPKTLPDATA